MRLTDEQLRESLHHRAERISAPAEVFPAVETRARRMRRNRRGVATLGAMAAVAAIAVTVPTVISSPGGHRAPVTGTTNSASQSASQSTDQPPHSEQPPTQTTPASNPATGMSLDPTHPWEYRGDQSLLAGAAFDQFQKDWSTSHPDSGALEPLFGQIYEPSRQPEMVFVAKVGDGARWGVAAKSAEGTRFLVDQPLEPNTSALAAALPGDEVARLLVVAAPTTKAIRYAPDGKTFTDMYALAPGVGITALEGDQAVDKIQVVGSNGRVVFEAPAPNS